MNILVIVNTFSNSEDLSSRYIESENFIGRMNIGDKIDRFAVFSPGKPFNVLIKPCRVVLFYTCFLGRQ